VEFGSPVVNVENVPHSATESADFERRLAIEKLDALAEFAAGAGHEINNPLTVISGRAQLLLREETDPERQHALALISAQAMRVYEMIADMMLFARPPRPEVQSVELLKLVDAVVTDLLPGAERQGTAIGRIGDPGAIVIEADPVQINVALRAICQNALEALGSGGHVWIDVERGADVAEGQEGTPVPWVKIHVRDDGPGIKPEEHRHLFDPFYSARQAGRGLGLGLSKAWRIVTNHGGRIEVASEPGHGATFAVVLPALQRRTS
jgi:signal transduction histidine kinase